MEHLSLNTMVQLKTQTTNKLMKNQLRTNKLKSNQNMQHIKIYQHYVYDYHYKLCSTGSTLLRNESIAADDNELHYLKNCHKEACLLRSYDEHF